MKLLSLTYFFSLFFLTQSVSSYAIAKVVQYDSTTIKTILPDKTQEENIFSKVDLDFAKKVEENDIGLWDRFLDWLSNLIFGKADYEDKMTMQRIFIWALVLVGVVVIIWLLARTEFTSFLRGNTKNAEFNFSDVEEDISGIDFNARVEKAVNESNYRLAIRWLYLKQLYLLNQNNTIAYQPYKTNIDYTQELLKSPYQASFITISRIYDYVWYGKYAITLNDYQVIEKQFNEFETSLNV